MATNYIQKGNTLTLDAPDDVLGGGIVISGSIIGVAAGDADADDPVDVHLTGVWSLPKVAADDMSVGEAIYWDAGDSLATVTSSGNTKLGVAVEAAGASTGTVKVRLNGAF